MERGKTRIDAVMAMIQSRIASRSYLPGTRLPSVRAQAKAMQLSVSTVVEAYERLAAEGTVHPRPGSGFYVSGPVAPLTLAQIGPRLDREVDPLWVSRSRSRRMPRSSSPDAAGFPSHGCMTQAYAAPCVAWREPARRYSPTTPLHLVFRRCGSFWPGAWPPMAYKPLPSRSC